MKSILLFFSFIVLIQNCTAQDVALSIQSLKEDLNILRYNLETVHADLYLYNTKEVIDDQFDAIEAQLNKPMSSFEFFQLLTPLHALIGNGHTSIALSKAYFAKIREEKKLLPFALYQDDGKIYILQNNSRDTTIVDGSVLEEINGQPTLDLVDEMVEKMTRDGDNDTGPRKRLLRNFNTRYLFYYPELDYYNCLIKDSSGHSSLVKVEALRLDECKKNKKDRYTSKESFWTSDMPAFSLDIEGKQAIMTLRTFDKKTIRKRNEKSKKWFQKSFAEINQRGVEQLVIDMRENGGGDPEPTIELFSHLYDKPFVFYKKMFTITNKIPNPKLYKGPIFLFNWQAKFKLKREGDIFRVKNVAGLKSYEPAKEQFTGEVIVLVDPYSFSATGEMTAILKEYDRVTFVGEEPGGNPNTNTSGVMLPLTLPNSQIRVTIPLVVFQMNVSFENTKRGIIPDYPLRNSIDDEIKGRDAVMEYVKELRSK